MTPIDILIQEIRATGFDADGDTFSIDEGISADNEWSVQVEIEGRITAEPDYTDDGLGYAMTGGTIVTSLKFQVFDEKDNLVVLSKEDYDRVHEAIIKNVE